jgi:predicted metal-dependent hydrolase
MWYWNTPMTDTTDGAAARALPRRRFFNDMPDKGLFALAAIAGFAIILGLKVTGYDPNIVAALAVSVMIAYGVIAYSIPAVRMRIDRLGDNFYYLGFIYTLASMTAALMQLRGGVEIEPILGSFGIALITTIVGVAGRVTLVQMRGEIDEIEEQTRRDLLAASNTLKDQLVGMLREFETFSTAMRQTAEETAKQSAEAARTMRQAADEAAKQSTEVAQKQIEIISRVAELAAGDIKRAFEGNRSSVQHLSDTVEKVAKAVDQTNKHLGEMELPTLRFEKQLETFGEQLVGLVKQLGVAAGLAKELHGGPRRWYWPFKRRFWPFNR